MVKRPEKNIVWVVLCRFLDMSLAKTAVSGAIISVYIGEISTVRNSTAQARAVRWDCEEYNNCGEAANGPGYHAHT